MLCFLATGDPMNAKQHPNSARAVRAVNELSRLFEVSIVAEREEMGRRITAEAQRILMRDTLRALADTVRDFVSDTDNGLGPSIERLRSAIGDAYRVTGGA
jgi:hypothetical protein